MNFDLNGGQKHLKPPVEVAGNTLNTEFRIKNRFCGGHSLLKQPFYDLFRWLYLPPFKNLPRAHARSSVIQYA